MRKLVMATTLVMVMVGSAVAQTGNNSSSSSKQGPWPAPVGHRQPRLDQVPDTSGNANDAAAKRDDAELDRKIKSICRGC
jgi:hypothetical protein